MRSMAWRMLLAFLAVAAVTVGTVAYAAREATREGLRAYVETGNRAYTQRVAETLADYYARNGTWDGAGQYLSTLARPFDDRLVLADTTGSVIADTGQQWVGRQTRDLGLGPGTQVTLDGRRVGEFYTIAGSSMRGLMPWSGGIGGMMGRGAGGQWRGTERPEEATTVVVTPEESFLASVNRGLWLGAAAAGALAVGLSLLLTRQIARPMRALVLGSRRVAAGNLSYRVEVASRDEIGDVARAFNAMAAGLERNELARRNLLADVAHELRTPLTIIEGTADGILDKVLEPSAEQIGVIKEEAALLAKLVGELRDLSLAEAGQLTLDRRPASLAAVVGGELRRLEPLARERGQELVAELDDTLPPASVDEVRLVQAIANLISNAVRHTPAGGRVTVSLQRDPSAAGRALITVADTGEGIPAEDLPHIFERFFRADKSRSRRSGGSGLGLAIAKQMVDAHGGRIWAESPGPGKGSAFHITLPLDGERFP